MSLVYEASARVRDPVYGCVGAISYLQNQVSQLQMQLAVAQAEILCIQMQQDHPVFPNCPQIHYSGDKLLPPPSQCLNFANSPNVIYDTVFGHDIVSWIKSTSFHNIYFSSLAIEKISSFSTLWNVRGRERGIWVEKLFESLI